MKRQFRVVRFFVLALLVAGVGVGGAAGGMESNAVTFTDRTTTPLSPTTACP
jgi:hypothetical protein